MSVFKHYLQLLVGAGLIVWGCEFLSGLVFRPELVTGWIGAVMILAGAAIGARAAYVARKGAAVLGSVLLMFAAVWAWNLHSYWDTSRFPRGRAPAELFLAPTTLILLGVFFVAFFRYLYPDIAVSKPAHVTPNVPDKTIHHVPETPMSAQAPSAQRIGTATPWYRLFLLACSLGMALLAGHLTGIADSVARAQVVIFVLILGCLATGLISEQTLIKIVPWKKD